MTGEIPREANLSPRGVVNSGVKIFCKNTKNQHTYANPIKAIHGSKAWAMAWGPVVHRRLDARASGCVAARAIGIVRKRRNKYRKHHLYRLYHLYPV